ncbi:YndJ family transporter, partial [Streptomyces sp. NPDC089915]|uniref:YndJ family transporter n=1 Tax=Streptomyces sp. NPDC089915 TaxID=3155186 RepID=UPI0034311E8F
MTVLVNLIVALGMLYAVPAGLRLIDPAGLGTAARLWPWAAVPGALSPWLPRGSAATVLAAVYAAAALALLGAAGARACRQTPVVARRAAPRRLVRALGVPGGSPRTG